jgi:hypothetical protein
MQHGNFAVTAVQAAPLHQHGNGSGSGHQYLFGSTFYRSFFFWGYHFFILYINYLVLWDANKYRSMPLC